MVQFRLFFDAEESAELSVRMRFIGLGKCGFVTCGFVLDTNGVEKRFFWKKLRLRVLRQPLKLPMAPDIARCETGTG